MKTTIAKSLGLLFASALFSLGVNAQTSTAKSTQKDSSGIIFSVGAEGGLSLGNLKNSHKWSVGGSVQVDVPVASQFYFTANAGYDNYFGKNDVSGTATPDIHLIPVMAGLKYFIIPFLYIQGDAGAAFMLNKNDLNYNKTAAFLYVPQIGVQLPVSRRNYIDISARYEGSTKFQSDEQSSKLSSVGLRVAYAFGTK